MKKKIAVLCVLLICLCFAACACAPGSGNDCLRIHIRANSNSQTDQKVKYLVKDAVVEYLTPLLASADTKDKAKAVVLSAREGIEAAAERVLAENGFRYGAEAELTTEVFPARTYGPLTLDSGEYEALIVNLGSGSGDNWWCVVYPPLCFVGGENTGGGVVYKSALLEIIKKFFS